MDRMKQPVAKSDEDTSGLLNHAAEKIKELGKKRILEYEIKKLEKEIENIFSVLGSEVFSLYLRKKLNIMKDASEVLNILNEIQIKENLIIQKEEELKQLKESQ